jgi:uncharacterized protein (DUF1330 family)
LTQQNEYITIKRKGGNMAKGNPIGFKHPEETKNKISIAMKNYYKTHTAWMTGKHHTLETKIKLSKIHKGRIMSEEWRKKIGLAHKGRITWIKGKHHTKSSKLKISKGMRGPNNPRWKGGRRIRNGYIDILKPDHKFAGYDGYVSEHRIIVEKFIGRYLTKKECVHHLNNNKSDNRIENLVVFNSHSNHIRLDFAQLVFDGRKILDKTI